MTAASGPIALPNWYAHVDTRRLTESAGMPATSGPETFCAGPLTVVNPGGGCQMVRFGADRASAALFEGYLFDSSQLAALLKGPVPIPDDATLAARAYERWGSALLDHLDGAFLIAIWDAVERRFVIGHDALGKHPVYYAHRPDGVWFSSNIFALAHQGTVSPQPNLTSFGLRLLGHWPLAGETFFADIHRLRPAHALMGDRSGCLQETRFWWPIPEDGEPWLPDQEALEQFETRFMDSVERCMQLDPQGILLSGGVDSVSVAAIASQVVRRNGREPLIAYSGQNPPGYPATYEEEMQGLVTQRLGMPHRPSHAHDWIGDQRLLRATLDRVADMPSPTDTWWAGAYMGFYRTIASEGTTVVLSGSGGDEWLGVDPSYAADLLRALALRRWGFFLRALRRTSDLSLRGSLAKVLWRYGIRLVARSVWARTAPQMKMNFCRRQSLKRTPGWLFPDTTLKTQIADTLAREVRVPELTDRGAFPRSYYLHTARFYQKNSIMHYEFEQRYHIHSMIGIRTLSPFHDRRLIDFANRLSPETLLVGQREKGLLRPLVASYLPGLGLENQRKLRATTDETYVGRELRDGLPDLWREIGCSRLDALGLVDAAECGARVREAAMLPWPVLSRLFNALSAEVWMRRHC